jgi:hypothetical protein
MEPEDFHYCNHKCTRPFPILSQIKPILSPLQPKIVDQKKHDKFAWLQDRTQSNEDNIENIKLKTVDIAGTKRECLRSRINELETNRQDENNRPLQPIGKSITLRRVTSLEIL